MGADYQVLQRPNPRLWPSHSAMCPLDRRDADVWNTFLIDCRLPCLRQAGRTTYSEATAAPYLVRSPNPHADGLHEAVALHPACPGSRAIGPGTGSTDRVRDAGGVRRVRLTDPMDSQWICPWLSHQNRCR